MTAAEPLIDFTIRLAGNDDRERRFIIETTAKVRQPHDVPWHEWGEGAKLAARVTLESGTALVAEADGIIIGFALWDQDRALSMIYVKRDLRGIGVGLRLLGPIPEVLTVTRPTPCWRQWTRYHKITWQAKLNPQPGEHR